jgi:hypothetical protein
MLRASFRLAPCWFHHETLRSLGGQDARCVRSTSATRTCFACTRTSRVPESLPPLSERGHPAESGLCAACPGNRVFHITRNASADRFSDTILLASRPFRCRRGSRAWAFSSHGAGSIEPLSSLSPLSLPVRAHASSRVLVVRAVFVPRFLGRRLPCGPNR